MDVHEHDGRRALLRPSRASRVYPDEFKRAQLNLVSSAVDPGSYLLRRLRSRYRPNNRLKRIGRICMKLTGRRLRV